MSFLAERLRKQTSDLANLLTSRIGELRNREGLVPCIKCLGSSGTKSSLFEHGEYAAVGIDGSMDYDELLEMLLFYVYATGFRCDFSVGESINFRLDQVVRDNRLAASASVPLWTEDLFYVTDETDSTEYDLARSAERIPYALMAMAELSLALRAVEDDAVRLIFLDRPIVNDEEARDWGLLLYKVGLKAKSGYGPIRVIDAFPREDSMPNRDLDHACFRKKESSIFEDKEKGITVKVVEQREDEDVIQVVRN